MSENTFPKKLMDKVSDDLKDSIDAMKEDELKKKIVEYGKAISFTENELSSDPEVLKLKEEMKAATEDYKNDLGMYNANLRFCVFALNNRGTAAKDSK